MTEYPCRSRSASETRIWNVSRGRGRNDSGVAAVGFFGRDCTGHYSINGYSCKRRNFVQPCLFLQGIKRPGGRRDDPAARVSTTPIPAHLNLKANTSEDEATHPRAMTLLFPACTVVAHLACDEADDTFMRDVIQNLVQPSE